MFSNLSIAKFRRHTLCSHRFSSTIKNSFWKWTTKERPNWKSNITEGAIACTVFGITGSSSLYFVRPILKQFGIEGSIIEGPATYRLFAVASFLITSPLYAVMLLAYGTLFGRHIFFAKMSTKILGRFLPRKVIDQFICKPALLKRNSN
eukprot:gene27375-36004_t